MNRTVLLIILIVLLIAFLPILALQHRLGLLPERRGGSVVGHSYRAADFGQNLIRLQFGR